VETPGEKVKLERTAKKREKTEFKEGEVPKSLARRKKHKADSSVGAQTDWH